MEQTAEIKEKISAHEGQITKLNQVLEVLNENLSKDIYAAVRKVTKQMESQSARKKQPIKKNFLMGLNRSDGEPDNSNGVSSETLLE